MTTNIRPLHDHVVVKPLEETMSAGGIVIPDTADKERPQQGIIVAAGPGKRVDGSVNPLDVVKGDKVLFSKYSGTEIKLDGERYLVLKESDLLAVLNG